ncbi:cytohesin-interacting protein [Engraulis encrasicolus]|uniref:cytohesin-interacting protein n=1 Tax=Engraulis encrasicolus TaxID=184585 RepID=UPI002FD1648C
MTSTLSFRTLVRQDSQNSQSSSTGREGSLKKKHRLWHRNSINSKGSLKSRSTGDGGLAARRQFERSRSNSLVDYSDPLRTTVVLEKQDNEVYGFEVQTYGVQVKNSTVLEMCTFVCTVQQDGSAETAGLCAGDVIVTINGISIEGSSHQDIIALIRESTNVLKLETVSGTVVKRIELDKKLSLLKQTLRERWVELQALTQQEKRLTRGNLVDSTNMPSLESLMSLASPASHRGLRVSSNSSSRSALISDSEDISPVFDSSFECSSPFSPLTPTNGDSQYQPAFFGSGTGTGTGPRARHSPLTRTHSMSNGCSGNGGGNVSSGGSTSSCGSPSPTWSANQAMSLFGTLPRKGRKQGSVRKQFLKFLPGINHSVEEEEVTS